MKFNKETIKRRFAYFIFWAWHLIYTVLVVALVIPAITYPLIVEASESNVPMHYVLYALTLTILPFISMYIGAKIFHGNYRNLLKYFYGFEMPLVFFLIVRIITFRDSNPGVSWLILNVSIALIAWFVLLMVQHRHQNQILQKDKDKYSDENKPLPLIIPFKDNPFAIAASTIIATVGLYFGTMFLIMMLPLAVEFIFHLGEELWSLDFSDVVYFFVNPLAWLLVVFLLFTMSLFIALPIVMIYLYIGQFIKRLPSLFTPTRIAIVLAVIAINAGGFAYFNQQPQQQVFTLLEEKMESGEFNDEARAQLLNQKDTIRKGLLNAYLARYRYVSTAGLSKRIASNYKRTFKLSHELANIPQDLFNMLAVPFLYDGKNWNDKFKAHELYETFFDSPIQKAERKVITDAVKHNWEMSTDNEAGLLDALSHYVHLNQQSIDVNVKDGVATILVKQTMENLTYQQREVVMHFSLPEDAVLTGLWLSEDKKDLKKFSAVLAPKGAAQAVYKAEVRRRVDPALLEQTGPYQYRLRVYPIAPKSHRLTIQDAKPMYMQFEYQTLVDVDVDKHGNLDMQWPLPKLLEKRNLFWDNKTEYLLNSKEISKKNHDNWLPKKSFHQRIKPDDTAYSKPIALIQGDNQISITYRDHTKETTPQKGNFAVLVDGSFSMQKQRDAIINQLTYLKGSSAIYTPYFCREECNPLTTPEALRQQQFFGASQTADHLKAFLTIKDRKQYDAIFILTDDGSYELISKSDTEKFQLDNTPLWLVHLGETVPYAYDDRMLDLIYQSKGGITYSLNEALKRYQLSHALKETPWSACSTNATTVAITQDRIWQTDNDPQHNCDVGNNPAITKIASAQQIKRLIRNMDFKTDENKLKTLDSIHSYAKAQHIVSHYSSMLVLVNDRQKDALKKAEEGDDRFDREIETGKQNTSNPADPFAVPSVPEPEEWALMIIIGVLLSWSLIRRRYGVHSGVSF